MDRDDRPAAAPQARPQIFHGRRLFVITAAFTLIMLLLTGRLFYLQVLCHEELAAAAASQQEIAIEGLDTRGMILDRNLQPLTGGTDQYYYIVSQKKEDAAFAHLMEELEGRQVARDSAAYHVYRTEKYDSDANEILQERYGAYVFRTQARYTDDQLACHLIGYLNEDEQKGVSGLELIHQDELAADGDVLTVLADGAGNIISGRAPAVRSGTEKARTMESRAVVTSIDRRLQYVCEKALSAAGESGAAVVMDVDSGEILAWASTPKFDPRSIEDYLDDGDCLLDKVSQGTYAPGSVFKLVTAIAALESGVCDEEQEFTCEGEVVVAGVPVKCTAAEQGHGRLDMGEALAVSCNCYFAQLGELTGCEEIVRTARRLGLGEKVLADYPQEEAGYIPAEEEVGPWDTTNISIGQGDILVTPLQIVRLTAVLAAGGLDVKATLYPRAQSEGEKERLISSPTAALLDEMMREVMASGSGAAVEEGDASARKWLLSARGKTGTAEALWQGEAVSNCWFTGYFTVGNRRYAVTVLVERGVSGSATALPVFRSVADFLAERS